MVATYATDWVPVKISAPPAENERKLRQTVLSVWLIGDALLRVGDALTHE